MRFKKGDRVEVFTKFGSWRSATINSGNGRKYMVIYDQPQNAQGRFDVDRVPRRTMRPLPPPVDGLEDLHPGDIVEVSYCGSWIVASVVSTVDGIHFFVRLFGAAHELRVHKIKLRLRLFWQDDQWFVTGKDHRLKQFWQDDQWLLSGKDHRNAKETTAVYEEIHEPATKKIQIPSLLVPATKKTKLTASWMVEDCESVCASSFANVSFKRKYDFNSGIHSKSVKRHRSLPLVKVAHASSQVIFDEKSLRDSFNNPLFETEVEESVASNDVDYFPSNDLEFDEAESKVVYLMSNNGNTTHDPPLLPFDSKANFSEDKHYDEDLSSSSEWRNYSSLKLDAAPDYRLELRAYRDTLEALYASGDISWEQEVMITNLRLSQKISNDEHLSILKQIVSNHL